MVVDPLLLLPIFVRAARQLQFGFGSDLSLLPPPQLFVGPNLHQLDSVGQSVLLKLPRLLLNHHFEADHPVLCHFELNHQAMCCPMLP